MGSARNRCLIANVRSLEDGLSVVANPKLSHHAGIGLTHAFPRNLSDFAVFKQKSVVHSKVGITALRGSIRRRRQHRADVGFVGSQYQERFPANRWRSQRNKRPVVVTH